MPGHFFFGDFFVLVLWLALLTGLRRNSLNRLESVVRMAP